MRRKSWIFLALRCGRSCNRPINRSSGHAQPLRFHSLTRRLRSVAPSSEMMIAAIAPFQLQRSTVHPTSGGPRSIPTWTGVLTAAPAVHFCPQCGQLTRFSAQAVVAPFWGNLRAAGVFVLASAGVSTKTSVPYGRLEGIMSKNENRLNFCQEMNSSPKSKRLMNGKL